MANLFVAPAPGEAGKRLKHRREDCLIVLEEGDGRFAANLPFPMRPSVALYLHAFAVVYSAGAALPFSAFQVEFFTPSALANAWWQFLCPPYGGASMRPALSVAQWTRGLFARAPQVAWELAELDHRLAPDESPVLEANLSLLMPSGPLTPSTTIPALRSVLVELGDPYRQYDPVWRSTPSDAYVEAEHLAEYFRQLAFLAESEPERAALLARRERIVAERVIPLQRDQTTTRVLGRHPTSVMQDARSVRGQDPFQDLRVDATARLTQRISSIDGWRRVLADGYDAVLAVLNEVDATKADDPRFSTIPMREWLAFCSETYGPLPAGDWDEG